MKKKLKKNVVTAFDLTAEALGNTRKVCKDYYVHPLLISTYEDGSIQKYFDLAKKSRSTRKYFTKSEIAFSELIQNYEINLESSCS
ncbi:hypothetical protein AAGS39_31500 [Flavobacterium sp. CGRL2]